MNYFLLILIHADVNNDDDDDDDDKDYLDYVTSLYWIAFYFNNTPIKSDS